MITDKLSVAVADETPGDDWRWVIPVEGFAPQQGDSARAHVRLTPEAAATVLTFSTQDGTIQLLSGEIVMTAAAAATSGVAPGAYAWDFEMTRDGKTTTIFVRCTLTVTRDVTR